MKQKIERICYRGKEIGKIYHDKECYVSPRTIAHKFRKFGEGFGMSESLLDYLQKCGISIVIINYCGREGYVATVDDFIVKGEDWEDKGDKQIILPLKYWKKEIKYEKQGKLI